MRVSQNEVLDELRLTQNEFLRTRLSQKEFDRNGVSTQKKVVELSVSQMNCSQKEITASSKIESRRNQNIYL